MNASLPVSGAETGFCTDATESKVENLPQNSTHKGEGDHITINNCCLKIIDMV